MQALLCPNCDCPIAPLRTGSYQATEDIEAGQVSNVGRTNFEVEFRTCPECATKLKRTAGPGEPWQFS